MGAYFAAAASSTNSQIAPHSAADLKILIFSLSPISPLYPYPIRAGGDSNMKFPAALAAVVAAMRLSRTITPTATPADVLPSQIRSAICCFLLEFYSFYCS